MVDRPRPADLLLACSILPLAVVCFLPSAAPARAQSAVDSAGVWIAENASPHWDEREGWWVEEDPVLQVGVVEGDPDYQLFRARYARRLPDGGVVLANTGTMEVRVYEADGRLRFTTGGTGGGPGEFRDMHHLGLLSGNILVHDRDLDRLTLLSPDGEVIRTIPLRESPGLPGADPWIRGIFSSGRLLVHESESRRSLADGKQVITGHLGVLSPSGELETVLGEFPYSEKWVVTEPGRRSYVSIPFSRSEGLAVAGERVFIGWTERFIIDAYDAEGRRIASIRRVHRPEPVTRAEIDRYFKRLYGDQPDSRRKRMARIYEEMKIPETKPAYRFHGLVADRTGNLWVRLQGEDRGRATWSIFNGGGRWLGDVLVPAPLSVTEIGDDYVLGFVRDDLGVQYLRLYRLRKDRGGTARQPK